MKSSERTEGARRIETNVCYAPSIEVEQSEKFCVSKIEHNRCCAL